eukprot:1161902-Pelagomonas_calceolata.AAC.12
MQWVPDGAQDLVAEPTMQIFTAEHGTAGFTAEHSNRGLRGRTRKCSGCCYGHGALLQSLISHKARHHHDPQHLHMEQHVGRSAADHD